MSVSQANHALGAILTGGESRRMGRDKALLEWRGMSLLERAAGTMKSVFSEVIVCGDPDRYSGCDLRVVGDRRSGVGPLAGLETALESARERPVFLLACDLARVPPGLIEHVMAEARDSDHAAAPAIDGRLQPLCALYRPTCRGLLTAFLDEGGRRALEFFGGIGGHTVELSPKLPFFEADLLLNLNRPADLDPPHKTDLRQDGGRKGAEA